MTDRERRLPKWAQEELRALRRENQRLRDHIEANEPPNADTFADDYGATKAMAPRRALGRGTRVSFYQTNDTHDWNNRVDVMVGGGWLTIRGGRSLVILPESSNSLRLRSE